MKALRQQKIRELVEQGGAVTVSDLAARFNTSLITIRRDLHHLEKEGVLSRTHGGAIAEAEAETFAATPYAAREASHADEKRAIAQRAAQMIKDGDSLILNAGTTMQSLAKALHDRQNLRIVTNGVTVAAEFGTNKSAQVYLIGGIVDHAKMATVGQTAEESLRDIRVPRAFLGVSGISVDEGLAMYNQQEAQINRTFIGCAREVTVLVDSSKFTSQAMYRIAPLAEVHRIITDAGILDADRSRIEDLGIELIVVE